jgi:hypothetical protein
MRDVATAFCCVQFKLQVPEVKGAKLALEKYKSERGVGLPLVIEVCLFKHRSTLSIYLTTVI